MTTRTWAAAFGLCAAVLQLTEIAFSFTVAGAPGVGAPAHTVHAYYTQHRSNIFASIAIDVLQNAAMLTFFGLIWVLLQRTKDGKLHKWSAESIWAAAVYAAITLASYVPPLILARPGVAPESATRLVWGINEVLYNAAYFPLAILLIVMASDARRAALVPERQARWGIVAGAFMLVGELSFLVQGDENVMAIVAFFGFYGLLASAFWMASLSVTLLRNRPPPGEPPP